MNEHELYCFSRIRILGEAEAKRFFENLLKNGLIKKPKSQPKKSKVVEDNEE